MARSRAAREGSRDYGEPRRAAGHQPAGGCRGGTAAAGADGPVPGGPGSRPEGAAGTADLRRVCPGRVGGGHRRDPPGVRLVLEPHRRALGRAAPGRAHPVGDPAAESCATCVSSPNWPTSTTSPYAPPAQATPQRYARHRTCPYPPTPGSPSGTAYSSQRGRACHSKPGRSLAAQRPACRTPLNTGPRHAATACPTPAAPGQGDPPGRTGIGGGPFTLQRSAAQRRAQSAVRWWQSSANDR
jgi:hypothetical protein